MNPRTVKNNHFLMVGTSQKIKTETLGATVLWLALLITSYFYCLPLGRFSVAGYQSDFRIYDFLFPAFFLFIGKPQWQKLRLLIKDRSHFYYYSVILIFLVILSLGVVFITSGASRMPVALIRVYRFVMYFLVGSYTYVIVDSPRKQRFILGVFYFNIVVQTFLAFAQGMKWLPSFWPEYWFVNYGFQPVGTLSPHHLQIGIVMFMGITLSMTFFNLQKNILLRLGLSVLIALMLVVAALAGIRTVWFALVGWVAAYFFVHRFRGVFPFLVLLLGIVLVFRLMGESVLSPAQSIIETRLLNPYRVGGVNELMSEREMIYRDPWGLVQSKPWVLLLGTGFQNISIFLPATGAHNNYLQALFELGIVGFIVFILFLYAILNVLRKTRNITSTPLGKLLAQDAWAFFIGILITMLTGETMWAQYSTFTLTGQIMVIIGIAASPLNWEKFGGAVSDDIGNKNLKHPRQV